MTFKMKGSPLQRNFSVGSSPVKKKDSPAKMKSPFIDHEIDNEGDIVAHEPPVGNEETGAWYNKQEELEALVMDAEVAYNNALEERPRVDREVLADLMRNITTAKNALASHGATG